MSSSAPKEQDEAAVPLLSPSSASTGAFGPALSPASRTKLQGRRYLSPESSLRPLDPVNDSSNTRATDGHDTEHVLSDKAKGKRPVRGDSTRLDVDEGSLDQGLYEPKGDKKKVKVRRGRNVTVMFANAGSGETGNLELWVEDGENVGSVKDQVSSANIDMNAELQLICQDPPSSPYNIIQLS